MGDASQDKAVLSQLRLRNFVKYKSEQTLNFDGRNGSVFSFVGSNGSGKSCLFEAIRRCMGSKNTVSLSSMCEDDNESLVVCTFKKAGRTLASIYMSWVNEYDRHSIKCLVSDTGNEVPILYRKEDTREPQKHADWAEYCIEIKQDFTRTLLDCHCTLDYKANILKGFPKKIGKSTVTSPRKFDKTFKSFVCIEFIFPIRPLGSIQSTAQLETSELKKRYSEGTKHSYIITHYLDQGEAAYDTETEKRIFDILTGGERYDFTIKDEVLQVSSDTPGLAIWKTPEGVLEAKYASVTLSNRRTDILLFEEPGRGMHQQMTDRLVNLIFSNKSLMGNKMVFLTTHNKDFLTHRSLLNTFLCLRMDQKTSEIKAASELQGTERETRQYIASGVISQIVFSQKVLFVEGDSDFMFVETLKHILLADQDLIEQFCNHPDKMFKFLANLSIGRLYGCGNVRKINDVFKNLGMLHNRYFLLDYDTIKNIDKVLGLDLNDSKYFDLKRLEEDGVFLWDDDQVENVHLSHDEYRPRKKAKISHTFTDDVRQSSAGDTESSTDVSETTTDSQETQDVVKQLPKYILDTQPSDAKASAIAPSESNDTHTDQLHAVRLPAHVSTANSDATTQVGNQQHQIGSKMKHKGTQCTGIARTEKDCNIRPGTIEDVVIRFCIHHDINYHDNVTAREQCDITGCIGLLKMLEDKKIATTKTWKTFGFERVEHKKHCMGKFLIQLNYDDAFGTVRTLIKTAIRYREGQFWRFLVFLNAKAEQ